MSSISDNKIFLLIFYIIRFEYNLFKILNSAFVISGSFFIIAKFVMRKFIEFTDDKN